MRALLFIPFLALPPYYPTTALGKGSQYAYKILLSLDYCSVEGTSFRIFICETVMRQRHRAPPWMWLEDSVWLSVPWQFHRE